MSNRLLNTKLYIPTSRSGLVRRSRLNDRLTHGVLDSHLLILVSAPAGFGKTTLVSDWIGTVKIPAGWLTLDSSDNEPYRFMTYLIASLQGVNPAIGKDLTQMLSGPEISSINSVLMELINQLAAEDDQFILVLDDYQTIDEPAIHEIVEYLIEHNPSQMHLVLITRDEPSLPVARLRGRGQLTELRLADLRFTNEEVSDFFNEVMGIKLSPDEIGELTYRTEGWIAGLLMSALVLKDESVSDYKGKSRQEIIQSITESDRYILEYLLEEVFQRQPESIKKFLLFSSILDRMNGSLCDYLLGNTNSGESDLKYLSEMFSPTGYQNSQEIIEYLEQANLFVIPLDRHKEWYRYHRLFADLLRGRLMRDIPAAKAALNRRASVWFDEYGYTDSAINHALEAEDFKRAAKLIEKVAVNILSRGEMTILLKWLNALPDEVMDDRPILYVYHSWVMFVRGQPVEEIEARLEQAQSSDLEGVISGELLMLRATLASVKGDINESVEFSNQALVDLPPDSRFFRGVTVRNLAAAYEDAGDLSAAINTFNQSVNADLRFGNIVGAVVGLTRLAGLRKIQGKLTEAKRLYEKALGISGAEDGSMLPVAGRAMIGLGDLYREWNDLEQSERRIKDGVELVERWSNSWAIEGYSQLALVKQSSGDPDGALRTLSKAEELAISYDASEMDDLGVKLTELRLFIMQGDVDSVDFWFNEQGLLKEIDNIPVPYSLYEIEHFLYAEILIAKREFGKSNQIIEELKLSAEKLGRNGSLIKILLLKALVSEGLNDRATAVQAVQRAIGLAEPENYQRTFIDEGYALAQLLYGVISQGMNNEYARRLLLEFDLSKQDESKQRGVDHPAFQEQSGMIEPLSERELDVLKLIARGLPNREISQQLFISLRTVKWHTGNIYQKLNVRNRTQAVNRARNLGII